MTDPKIIRLELCLELPDNMEECNAIEMVEQAITEEGIGVSSLIVLEDCEGLGLEGFLESSRLVAIGIPMNQGDFSKLVSFFRK